MEPFHFLFNDNNIESYTGICIVEQHIQTQQTYVLQAKHLLFKYRREEGRKEKDESKTGREAD